MMVERERQMTRTGTIVWSTLGLAGSLFLLLCAGLTAAVGFSFSVDAPHAWKGDPRVGLAAAPVTLGLLVFAVLTARRSLAWLRALGGTSGDRAARSKHL